MTRTQGDLAALSRFVFRAPDWSASLFFALLIAALAGVAAFDDQFVLDDAFQGMVYIGVPTVVAAFVTPHVDRALGGRLTYNRSALLALVCEVVVVVFLVAAAVVAVVTGLGQVFIFDALLVGLASIFALRLFVIMAVSSRGLLVAAVPASVQTAVAAALVVGYAQVAPPDAVPNGLLVVGPADFTVLVVLCVVYALAVYLFVVTIDRPWRRSLGVSVLDFIRGFIGHIAEDSRELEAFFEALGERAVVPVTVLSFRRPDGTEKARFVLPMVHPGPMGEIGGGNLPERIAAATDGLAFVPHATAGHDFNLVTEREVDTLVDAAERAAGNIEYAADVTESLREHENESTLFGQAFGDDALVVATHAPDPADDIDFSVGLSTAAEARASGLERVMLVDAHNCNDGLGGDSTRIVPGSRRSFDMMAAAGRLGDRLAAADTHPLRVGVAADPTDWSVEDGIGPLGVRVAVVEAARAPTPHRTAYVLVDGNNMEPGLRDAVVEALDTDEAEVMTSDTHAVNTVDAANQVGARIDHDDLVALIERLVLDAIEDLEHAEVGMSVEHTEVTVFGNDRTETLASHANAMVQMGGVLFLVVIGAAMAVSLLVFLLTG